MSGRGDRRVLVAGDGDEAVVRNYLLAVCHGAAAEDSPAKHTAPWIVSSLCCGNSIRISRQRLSIVHMVGLEPMV